VPATKKDLYEDAYKIRTQSFQELNLEPNIMMEASAKLSAAFVQRLVQKRAGRNAKYPYIRKPDIELLGQYHSAIYEVAYHWRQVWALARGDVAKLAFLIEDSIESLLALGHRPPEGTTAVEIFMALLDPRDLVQRAKDERRPNEKPGRVIDSFSAPESAFRDEVPSDKRLLKVYDTVLDGAPFLRRQFRQRLREIVPRGSGSSEISHAWANVISAIASALIWAYSEVFRTTDRETTTTGSAIAMRAAAIEVYLMEPFLKLGSVILSRGVAELGGSSSGSIDTEYDPLSSDDILEI